MWPRGQGRGAFGARAGDVHLRRILLMRVARESPISLAMASTSATRAVGMESVIFFRFGSHGGLVAVFCLVGMAGVLALLANTLARPCGQVGGSV